MPWTGWLMIAAIVVAWFAIQFAPELLKSAGIGLDRLPPKLGLVLLAVTILAILLAGTLIPAGNMNN